MKDTSRLSILLSLATACAAIPALADTHDVATGVTDSLSNISETTSTKKTGDGTLALSGANTLKRLQVSAGSVNIHGGSTTISDSTATGTGTGAQVFEQIAGDTVIDGGPGAEIQIPWQLAVNLK